MKELLRKDFPENFRRGNHANADFANWSTRLKDWSRAALADSRERKPGLTWFPPPRVKLRFGLA
jgi:hypothetical protein